MKRFQRKRHLSNDGFSLMELIVTVLISGIVTTAAVAFLSVGMRFYWNADDETKLQTESQIAEAFLTELFQESKDFKKLDSSTYPADVTYVFEVIRKYSATEDYSSLVALKGTELWYKELTPADSTKTDAEKISDITGENRRNVFLADKVTFLSLSEDTWEEAMNSGNGLVELKMTFNVNGREYTERTWISLRNRKRN